MNKLWRDGPELPHGHVVVEEQFDVPPECLEELQARQVRSKMFIVLLASEAAEHGIENLVEIRYFRNSSQLMNTMRLAYMLKFCSIL